MSWRMARKRIKSREMNETPQEFIREAEAEEMAALVAAHLANYALIDEPSPSRMWN